MNRPLAWGSCAALLGASGLCHGVIVTGNVKYTDGAGAEQPARRIKVEVWAAHPFGDFLVADTRCDTAGDWSVDAPVPPGTVGFFVRVVADNDATTVTPNTTDPPHHLFFPGIGVGGGATPPIVIDTSVAADANRAFAVADAMQTGWLYAGVVRDAGAPVKIRTVFPTTAAGTASFYDPSTGFVHIRQWRRYAWDVLLHEYSHRLAHIDSLDSNPGGSHSFGVSNIPALGKDAGTRLAWGEALATYNGTAAQFVAPHPPSPTTGDTIYTSLHTDTPASTFSVNIDTHAGSSDAGEGDEASVARILWDLADGTGGSEAHDRVTFGFNPMYDMIDNDIPGITRLDHLWDYLFTRPGTTDADRVDYGAIFEEYWVSPSPTGTMVGGTITTLDPPPTFEWLRRNNSANDTFNLIVFDFALSTRILDIAVPGDVTSYTLTAAQWATLLGSPLGDYRWIVGGSDTDGGFTTGSYWSDARTFHLVPTPGALALLAFGWAAAPRRRR